MKKIIAVVLIFAMLFGTTGCASLMQKDYYEVTDYVEETTDTQEDTSGVIKNYSTLLRAINRMVLRHETDGRLTFSNYEGNISEDLTNACWEVKNNTAIGAFSVDYMSYDLSRIVSYYEADIYITYRRTKTQVESIESISATTALRSHIQTAMENGETYLLVSLNTIMTDEDTIEEYVREIYSDEQLQIISMPDVTVNIYPETGSEKIFEIIFDYGFQPDELREMKSELTAAVSDFVLKTPKSDNQAQQLGLIYEKLRETVTYDPDSSERISLIGEDDGLGATAYGVFVDNLADSRGYAMATGLLCRLYSVDCITVEGMLEADRHCWNIVRIDENYFHMDLSQHNGKAMLRSDDSMLMLGYSWNSSDYPACERDGNLLGHSTQTPAE